MTIHKGKKKKKNYNRPYQIRLITSIYKYGNKRKLKIYIPNATTFLGTLFTCIQTQNTFILFTDFRFQENYKKEWETNKFFTIRKAQKYKILWYKMETSFKSHAQVIR